MTSGLIIAGTTGPALVWIGSWVLAWQGAPSLGCWPLTTEVKPPTGPNLGLPERNASSSFARDRASSAAKHTGEREGCQV